MKKNLLYGVKMNNHSIRMADDEVEMVKYVLEAHRNILKQHINKDKKVSIENHTQQMVDNILEHHKHMVRIYTK